MNQKKQKRKVNKLKEECEICKHNKVDSSEFPCRVCIHIKPTLDNYFEPVTKPLSEFKYKNKQTY